MSKLPLLRKALFYRLALYGGICIAIASIAGYIASIRTATYSSIAAMHTDILLLRNQLDVLRQKEQSFSEATALWVNLDSSKKKREGLKIDAAEQLLQSLKERYRLTTLQVNLSTPADLPVPYTTQTVSVVSSDVTVRLTAVTDEQILSTFHTLIAELPGYTTVKSLMIRRSADLTPETLTLLRKGELPGLIQGEITLQWRNLRDLPLTTMGIRKN